MRTLLHLARLIWAESGKLARIGYGAGILIPSLLAKPWTKAFQESIGLDRFWGALTGQETAIIELSGPLAAVIAIGSMLVWTIWGLSKITLSYEDQLRPKVRAYFGSNSGGLIETPVKKKSKSGQVLSESSQIYIRGCVESLAKTTAQDCTVHLVDIKKKNDEDRWEDTAFIDPIQLPWSHIGVTEVKIPYFIKRHFDILFADQKHNQLSVAAPWPLTLRGIFDAPGTFLLKIVVTAQEISGELLLEVEWNGIWDKIKVREVN